jgi:hypothetical protein
MDHAIKGIVGKTIKGIVVKKSEVSQPRSQVFLVFDDDTHYEFYSTEKINGIKGIDPGGMGKVKEHISNVSEIIVEYEKK